jgi:hypothetical protein
MFKKNYKICGSLKNFPYICSGETHSPNLNIMKNNKEITFVLRLARRRLRQVSSTVAGLAGGSGKFPRRSPGLAGGSVGPNEKDLLLKTYNHDRN